MRKVSIITVVYNAELLIEKTLKSVIQQSYPNLEFLVIDGNSKDNTPAIIEKYKRDIDTYISEPDKGIYDAMNKGVRLATGDYILFMNAGDWFVDSHIVKNVMNSAPLDIDMIYGNHYVIYDNFIKHKTNSPIKEIIWKEMPFSHQALFAKRTRLLENPFDNTTYPLSADFNFIYTQYQLGRSFFDTKIFIANYMAGGASDTQVINSYKETWEIVKKHNPSLKIDLYHWYKINKQLLIVTLRRLIPIGLFMWLMKIKNR